VTSERRTTLSVAAGVGLLVAAVALFLLAVQVSRWPTDTRAADRALFAAPREQAHWDGNASLAARLLGASDDISYRRAVALALRARPENAVSERTAEQVVAAVEASIELARVVRMSDDAVLRSRAANLEGVLVGEDAIFDSTGGPRVARAAELFRRAIALDPGNDLAKANLELLYRLAGTGAGAGEDSTPGFGGFGDASGAAAEGQGY
jgi:hypothetical protein